jgi:outer membrane protein OmpA-like peptidoglycan-associated protein
MQRPALFAGLFALALAATLPPAALAQADDATRSLIERLRPQPGGPNRGIRLPPEGAVSVSGGIARPSQAATRAEGTTAPVGTPAASITVNFGHNSAVLSPEAERALMPLGQALASNELAAYRFRIEGHTDNTGDSLLNQSLSERRAQAVRSFLQSRYGIRPERLEALGLGDRQLLVATPPQTSEPRNRRVQVLNLGG